MAEVIWSDQALDQLDRIVAYIDLFDAGAADRVARRLLALGDSLCDFSQRGRPGPRDTRELVAVRPYILRYRIIDTMVLIVDVRHSARLPAD